ncbi:MAG: hypothetical protein NWF00_09705 [Candidatus Bathyarchaeota archaeon]|nr:hypothetical protein [Candidatus Bathyarchaeota archaeon]
MSKQIDYSQETKKPIQFAPETALDTQKEDWSLVVTLQAGKPLR